MTQDDKDLLLRDLCARLPYGVKIHNVLYGAATLYERIIESFIKGYFDAPIPYLRPMSSMTDDEALEFMAMTGAQFIHANLISVGECKPYDISDIIDWFNEHHFDHRGLINKGLAIEVTKENNPYKD